MKIEKLSLCLLLIMSSLSVTSCEAKIEREYREAKARCYQGIGQKLGTEMQDCLVIAQIFYECGKEFPGDSNTADKCMNDRVVRYTLGGIAVGN